jgi:hypothetical protein
MDHCPESGKIYILIIFSLVFTTLLTTINVLSKTKTNYQLIDDNLFGTGVSINIIQTIFTLLLITIDIFGKCNKTNKSIICVKNCKWSEFNRFIYVKYPIILLSSTYMLSFGIINIFQTKNSNNTEQDLSTISIASFIIGIVGMLYILSDIICSMGCKF